MALPVPSVEWTMDPAEISGATVEDQGSLGVDGTLVDSPTTGVATDRPQFFGTDFDGSTQLCEAPMSSIPSFASCSAGAYLRVDSGVAGSIAFGLGISVSGGSSFRGLWAERVTDGRLGVAFEQGSGETLLFTTKTFAVGEWFAFVVTWSGTTLSLHVMDDTGYEKVSVPATGLVLEPLGHLRFGAYHPEFGTRFMNGVVSKGRLDLDVTMTDDQAKEYLRQFFPLVTLGSQTPAPSAIEAQPTTISCLVDDPGGDGIDLTNTVITAESDQGIETVYDGSLGGYQAGWSGSVTPGGTAGQVFSFSRDAVFPVVSSSSVTIRVQAQDALDDGSNALDESWTFQVTQSLTVLPGLKAESVGGTVLEVEVSTPGAVPDGLYYSSVGPAGGPFVAALGTQPGALASGLVKVEDGRFVLGIPSMKVDTGYQIQLVSASNAVVLDLVSAFDVVGRPYLSSVYSVRSRLPGTWKTGPRAVESEE